MSSVIPLLLVFIIAVLTKNNLLGRGGIVFFIDLMRLNRFFP